MQKAEKYFSSDAGKRKIQTMVENFFQERGRLWQMIEMVVGHESLAERIQPELIKFLNHPRTKKMLYSIIESEVEKLENVSVAQLVQKVDEQSVLFYVKRLVEQLLNVEKTFNKPIAELIAPFQTDMEKKVIPQLLEFIGTYLASQSGNLLKRFQVEEMIREQIESFSLQHLETLVISIAKRELVMITYLGAILGGGIGLIQGVIVMLTS